MKNNLSNFTSVDRFERKWAIEKNIDFNSFLIAVYRSKFNFIESYNCRKINTIYFDDNSYSSINENLDGTNYKQKYRLRWYGDADIIVNPQLEIKSKVGFVSNKKTYPLNISKDIKLNYNGIEEISKIFIKKLKTKKILYPVLSTHYLRHYFISSNKHIRATFDRNLKSYQICSLQNLSFKKDFNNSVFEIKYDKNFDNYVKNNLKDMSLRVSKSSKYVISALDEPVSFS